MAPKTPEDIQDLLDEAFGWRRIELHALGGAIADAEKKSPNAPLTRALARSGVALLYAHWEGFFKEACQGYVDYVAKRRLLYSELNDGFLESAIVALMKRTSSGERAGALALIESIRTPDRARARIPKNSIVDTKSNLRFAVLADVMKGVGFSHEKFSTKDKIIDKTLCDGRNSIAHGRDYFPAAGSFGELLSEVLEMMEDLRSIILTSVKMKHYRKAGPIADAV